MKPDVWDVLAFAGLASVAYGVYQIYPPAAYIVVGAFVMLVGIFGSRPPARAEADGD